MTAYTKQSLNEMKGINMKNLKQFFTFSLLIIALCVFLGSCGECEHIYDNDCDASCNECGEEREVNHNWKDATCEKPRTCKICGEEEGSPNGHSWVDGGCAGPRRCAICGKTSGVASSHTPNADDGDCTTPVCCAECGSVITEALEHTSGEYTVFEDGHTVACGNEGCTHVSEKLPHVTTGIIGEDKLERCECGYILADHGHVHENTVLKHDENGHWYECACGESRGDTEPHEATDDGDCTTDAPCSVCGETAISGRDAHVDENHDGKCDSDGCNKDVDDTSGGKPSDTNEGVDLPMDENN